MDSTEELLPTASDPWIGRVLHNRYRIKELIGRGGMGSVYAAEHVVIQRRVAVKLLHAQYAMSADVVARFRREAMAAAAIGNEHIVDVTDMSRLDDGSLFMVLEFLEGRDLGTEIEEAGPLSVERTLNISIQICEALAAAHGKGIIHRDLKPENVFLMQKNGARDFVKVLDFGISKFLESPDGLSRLTNSAATMGTPAYMPPEQCRGAKNVDARSDLYAIGAIMFRCLTGRLPFEATTLPELILKICTDPVPSVLASGGLVSSELDGVIARLLAKDPASRFQTPSELRAVLVKMLERSSIAPKTSPSWEPLALASTATSTEVVQIAREVEVNASKSAPLPILPENKRISRNVLVAVVVLAITIFGVWSLSKYRTSNPPAAPPRADRTSSAAPTAPAISLPNTVAPTPTADASTDFRAPANRTTHTAAPAPRATRRRVDPTAQITPQIPPQTAATAGILAPPTGELMRIR